MAQVEITRLTEDEIRERGIKNWPIWTKEVSRFDWHYDEQEQCLFLEGKVTVETADGAFSFGKGDFVTFQRGLDCVWNVQEPVKKHYQFG